MVVTYVLEFRGPGGIRTLVLKSIQCNLNERFWGQSLTLCHPPLYFEKIEKTSFDSIGSSTFCFQVVDTHLLFFTYAANLIAEKEGRKFICLPFICF